MRTINGKVRNKYDYSKSVHGTIVKGKYVIEMYDCYSVKEDLKALGYKWDPYKYAWYLVCKPEELGNAIAEVTIKVDLPLREYKQLVWSMSDTDLDVSKITMDDELMGKLKEHFNAKK